MGVWLTTAQRVSKGWGHLPNDAWPYEPERWPPVEPSGVDVLAKKRRTTAYIRCRTLNDCRQAIENGHGVLAAFQVDASWIASDGHIGDPRDHKPEATHSLLLFGHSDDTETFRFAHNWGPNWGDEGFGSLPYRYWSDRLLEAWIPDNRPPAPLPPTTTSREVVWAMSATDPWGRSMHVIDLRDLELDEIQGWAILVETSSGLELEEFFVRSAFRNLGHGQTLVEAVKEVQARRGHALRGWVSHADWPLTQAAATILDQLGLTPKTTTERWAAACAVETTD